MMYMWHGCKTLEEAKEFKKQNRCGVILRWERPKDRYEIWTYRQEGLSDKYPFVVAWNAR